MSEIPNFKQLHAARLARSTKPFLARGMSVKRCSDCFLAEYACVCQFKCVSRSDVDLVLLMHSDEILKPTNTGRLISDVLPNNCWVYEWHRTEISKELINLLQDPSRQIAILYPDFELERATWELPEPVSKLNKKLTLVVLDGTWRQARRMLNQSKWLNEYPLFKLKISQVAQYNVRKAPKSDQLSTAEATAMALAACGQLKSADILTAYFCVFNYHYQATRACIKPEQTEDHTYLLNNQY